MLRVRARAIVAAALLVLFYGLLAVVTYFGVMIVRRAFTQEGYLGAQRVIVAVFGLFFVVPAVRVVNAAVRRRAPDQRGVAVERGSQPQLWSFIESLAVACRVPAPTRIVVTGEVNAAAESSGALFGTLRRERTVYLGLPLLAAMDTAQAAAVVCHELGHHANGDSRLAALTYRSGDSLLSVLRRGRLKVLGWLTEELFTAFAGVYFSVTFAVRRAQEFGADQLAARTAGAEATATALESLPLVRAAYSVYLRLESADVPGSPAERAADLVGFRGFYDSVVIELAPDPRDRRRELYDSHPPLSERVAAVRKTGQQPALAIPSGKAIELLQEPDRLARAVVDATNAQKQKLSA